VIRPFAPVRARRGAVALRSWTRSA
jgi:hypothetical protein